MTLRDLATIFDGSISIYIKTDSTEPVSVCIFEGDFDHLEKDPKYKIYLDSEISSIREDTEEIFSDPEHGNQLDVYVNNESVMRC